MKTVIMAGGKGTRLASIASDIPKPMVRLRGKPLLEYQLECLRENHLVDIIMVVGHLGEAIKSHFGDGSAFGCRVSYYSETDPLGTAGALYKIAGDLSEDFILLNGDIVFDIDFSRIIAFHRERKALVSLAVHPNSHPFDSAILVTDGEDRIIKWLNKEDPRLYYRNQVNSGIHVLSRKILSLVQPKNEKIDLDREILKALVPSGNIYAYRTPEYIRDAGTPERFSQIEKDIARGTVKRRNLSVRQKAVFLDRDGTINKLKGFVTHASDLELLEGAAEGIREINRLGYLSIVITNQPVIARGESSLEELDRIHQKMETELGKSGAYLDDIFFCPHHPQRGFSGEREEYKIDCDCRKPRPGMILKAAEKYNIDLAQSYMAGDDNRDIEAALAAGCSPVFIGPRSPEGKDIPCFPDLPRFAEFLQSVSA